MPGLLEELQEAINHGDTVIEKCFEPLTQEELEQVIAAAQKVLRDKKVDRAIEKLRRKISGEKI